MVVDPGTAMLVSAIIGAGAAGTGGALANRKAKKASKIRSKELERETKAGLVEDALQRENEAEAHRLSSSAKKSKRGARTMQETADMIRGAFNI